MQKKWLFSILCMLLLSAGLVQAQTQVCCECQGSYEQTAYVGGCSAPQACQEVTFGGQYLEGCPGGGAVCTEGPCPTEAIPEFSNNYGFFVIALGLTAVAVIAFLMLKRK